MDEIFVLLQPTAIDLRKMVGRCIDFLQLIMG